MNSNRTIAAVLLALTVCFSPCGAFAEQQASLLVVSEGRFSVGRSVADVTIVVSQKGPGTAVQVVDPRRRIASATQRQAGMQWSSAPNADVIRVSRPLPGIWNIRFSTGGSGRIYLYENVTLQGVTHRVAIDEGTLVTVQGWLGSRQKIITARALLDEVPLVAELATSGGKTMRLALTDDGSQPGDTAGDGVFTGNMVAAKEEDVTVRLTAEGGLFTTERVMTARAAAEQQVERAADGAAQPGEPEEVVDWSAAFRHFRWINMGFVVAFGALHFGARVRSRIRRRSYGAG